MGLLYGGFVGIATVCLIYVGTVSEKNYRKTFKQLKSNKKVENE